MSKRPADDAAISVAKRTKSDSSPSINGGRLVLTGDALIAQKRAEIAAKLAVMTGKKTTVVSGPIHTGPAAPQTGGFSKEDAADLQRRIEEARKKVNAARAKTAIGNNPYLAALSSNSSPSQPPPVSGLAMSAHPLLLDTTPIAPQSKKDRYKPMKPKFATLKANASSTPVPPPVVHVPVETKANPYSATNNKEVDGIEPKERAGRQLKFNVKGKYKAIGEQIRKDAQLEALKQRIAESAKKAGLDTEFETAEKNVRRGAPPAAEWWDESLLPGKAYDEFSLANAYIRTSDSPINMYIQHPIPIPAPGDRDKVKLNPLKMTTKEQKKLRKGRRQAELQDKRDHIRMGLLPPDPPKVRLGNLMRVLTSDAVQDPTRVEARVRREVALRKHGHEKANNERKLGPEERKVKIEEKQIAQEAKGLYAAVYRIKNLSDPAHRFKVRKNAEQTKLTGVCIFNPNFNMVYVEGAGKYIRKYKKLMLHRIAWTQAARPRGDMDADVGDDAEQEEAAANSTLEPTPDATSLDDNECHLVWEGQILERSFNNFRPKSCPTDNSAREALGQKLASRWDSAKNWRPEEFI